jgi:hypothetical protein
MLRFVELPLYPRFRVVYPDVMTHQDGARTQYGWDQDGGQDGVRTASGRLKMTVPQTASYLNISAEAVRARIQRGTLEHTKENGKVYVLMERPNDRHDDRHDGHSDARYDDDHVQSQDGVRTDEQSALISELRDHNDSLRGQVDHLRRELEVRNEELRRKDHLLAAALERIPPELPAPQEAPGSPETSSEGKSNGHIPPEPQESSQRRSWLYRFFFGP